MGLNYTGHQLMLDTNCFIYLIEGENYPSFLPIVEELFAAISGGTCTAVTSTITLVEVMTLPRKLGREDLAYTYKMLIANFPNLQVIPIDADIADKAATLRASFGLKTPDALQIATGLATGASDFVTFDRDFYKIASTQINVLYPG